MSKYVRTVMGAIALSATVTAVSAEEEATLKRVTINHLPDVSNHTNSTIPAAQRYRNPWHRKVEPPLHDSIGLEDARRPITHDEEPYSSVVQMIDHNSGNPICTATVSIVEGFESKQKGTIISTVAHCLDIEDKQGNIIGYRNPEDIFFKGSFLNKDGKIEYFQMRGDETWVNPLYEENRKYHEFWNATSDRKFYEDTALIFSKTVLPNSISPAILISMDFAEAQKMQAAIIKEHTLGRDVRVSVVGHAVDKPYLTIDKDAVVVSGDTNGLNTKSDVTSGSSGGPATNISINEENVGDDNAPLRIIAVTSNVIPGTDHSTLSYFNKIALNSVPFLKPEEDPDNSYCFQRAEVMATKLNRRLGADTYLPTLVPEEGKQDSMLSKGDLVDVLGITKNLSGQLWALVTGPDGRTGYVSANTAYLGIQPKICIPF